MRWRGGEKNHWVKVRVGAKLGVGGAVKVVDEDGGVVLAKPRCQLVPDLVRKQTSGCSALLLLQQIKFARALP